MIRQLLRFWLLNVVPPSHRILVIITLVCINFIKSSENFLGIFKYLEIASNVCITIIHVICALTVKKID